MSSFLSFVSHNSIFLQIQSLNSILEKKHLSSLEEYRMRLDELEADARNARAEMHYLRQADANAEKKWSQAQLTTLIDARISGLFVCVYLFLFVSLFS